MSSPDLITLFVEPLNGLGIEYMVSGAVASILYGEPRLTNDVDVVAVLKPSDVPRIAAAFSATEFYVPPAEAIADELRHPGGGHFNVIHVASALKVDIYTAGRDGLNAWGLAHRRPFEVDGCQVWTAPPEYVILRKLEYWRDAGSEKHVRDIRAMLRTLGETVDHGMITTEASQRGLSAQWAMVQAEA